MSTNVLTPPRSSHTREGAPREYAPPARAYSAEYPLTQRRALPVRTVAYRRLSHYRLPTAVTASVCRG